MTTPQEWAIVALLAGGVFFVFVGAVGVIRLPDLYTRTHAASKSDTLGVVLSLGAATLVFENFSMQLKVFALLLFMLVTTPTATHAIARAAFDQGIDPWTVDDDDSSHERVATDRGSVDDDGPTDVGVTDGGTPDGRTHDGRTTDDRTTDSGSTTDERASAGGEADGRRTDSRATDDHAANDRAADGGAD